MRWFWLLVWVFLVAYAYWLYSKMGILTSWAPIQHLPDVGTDKYATIAAFTGGNPYATISQLTSTYGGWPAPAPRPPAAFLFLAPLTVVADGWLYRITAPINAAVIGFALWAGCRIGQLDERIGALLYLALAVPVLSVWWLLVWSGSATVFWLAAFAAGWLLIRSRPRVAGILFGAATSIKLWPGIVLVVLLVDRHTRKVALAGIGTFAVLTGAGLLLPGVNAFAAVKALVAADKFFRNATGTNLSLTSHLGVLGVSIGVAALVVAHLRHDFDWRIGWSTLAGLALSPLVWPYYLLAAFPAAALTISSAIDALREEGLDVRQTEEIIRRDKHADRPRPD